jgi:hypothetical protein
MSQRSNSTGIFKALIAIAAAVAALLIGRKVVKEVRKRRTQEEY